MILRNVRRGVQNRIGFIIGIQECSKFEIKITGRPLRAAVDNRRRIRCDVIFAFFPNFFQNAGKSTLFECRKNITEIATNNGIVTKPDVEHGLIGESDTQVGAVVYSGSKWKMMKNLQELLRVFLNRHRYVYKQC